jgi:hypothetical protein
MKPDPACILNTFARMLRTSNLTRPDDDYLSATQSIMGELLAALAADFDTAVARCLEENTALRALFAAAAGWVEDPYLKQRLLTAAGQVEQEYAVSALDRANQDLIRLLIDLHVHVEALPGDAARRLEGEIWKALSARVMRRLPVVLSAFVTV